MATHPPFVFGAEGEELNREGYFSLHLDHANVDKYKTDYVNQLIFMNKKIEAIIDKILTESSRPPVIILQADHGAAFLDLQPMTDAIVQERIPIFSSYYLPGHEQEGLYEEISPVNSFRVIFNKYFGANLELLEDRSYYSAFDVSSYGFVDVTDTVRTGTSAYMVLSN